MTKLPPEVQGEGNYDAARKFNEAERKFVDEGKVEQAAADAAPKSDAEVEELTRAEEIGRERSKGEDPTDWGEDRTEDERNDGDDRDLPNRALDQTHPKE
jgi:hypothetical protein